MHYKYLSYFKIYLITVLFFAIIWLYLKHSVGNDSTISEWIINYQGGFVRRGLLGEIAWQLNEIFFVEPRVFFSFLFLIIYFFQIILFFNLFKKFIVSRVFFIFIFFSPSLLLFHIYNPDLFFLKDAIIKLVFLLHAFILYEQIFRFL